MGGAVAWQAVNTTSCAKQYPAALQPDPRHMHLPLITRPVPAPARTVKPRPADWQSMVVPSGPAVACSVMALSMVMLKFPGPV